MNLLVLFDTIVPMIRSSIIKAEDSSKAECFKMRVADAVLRRLGVDISNCVSVTEQDALIARISNLSESPHKPDFASVLDLVSKLHSK